MKALLLVLLLGGCSTFCSPPADAELGAAREKARNEARR